MTITPEEVLDLQLYENTPEAYTVRDYLRALLVSLWQEGDCFDSKRPFGNSDWEYEIIEPIVAQLKVSDNEAFELVHNAISAL